MQKNVWVFYYSEILEKFPILSTCYFNSNNSAFFVCLMSITVCVKYAESWSLQFFETDTSPGNTQGCLCDVHPRFFLLQFGQILSICVFCYFRYFYFFLKNICYLGLLYKIFLCVSLFYFFALLFCCFKCSRYVGHSVCAYKNICAPNLSLK